MVEINELVLRIPGLRAEEGRQFGEKVARRVAAQLPEGYANQRIGELNLRLTALPDMASDEAVKTIADQIIQQLKTLKPR